MQFIWRQKIYRAMVITADSYLIRLWLAIHYFHYTKSSLKFFNNNWPLLNTMFLTTTHLWAILQVIYINMASKLLSSMPRILMVNNSINIRIFMFLLLIAIWILNMLYAVMCFSKKRAIEEICRDAVISCCCITAMTW